MKKTILILIAILTAMLMVLPTWAFVDVDTETYDPKFEMFGPHIDTIFIKMYAGPNPEFEALRDGLIDLMERSLTKAEYELVQDDPNIAALFHPPPSWERGYFEIAINQNNETTLGPPGPADPNPKYPNPTANVPLRQAIAHLINRTLIGDWAIPMYTEILPAYMEGWLHTAIRPGGVLENLTYPFNVTMANEILENNGFPLNTTTGWRWPDFDEDGVQDPNEKWDSDNQLDFYIRQDIGLCRLIGEDLEVKLDLVGIPTQSILCSGGLAYQICMIEKDFHMYTGGWTLVGPEPDYLYDFHHSSMYWHSPESASPNYQRINDSALFMTPSQEWPLDPLLEGVKFAKVIHDPSFNYPIYPSDPTICANSSCWKAQERMCGMVHDIPLFALLGVKAVYKTYTDLDKPYTGAKWRDFANEQGFGLNSWFSFLNAYPEGYLYSTGVVDEEMVMQYGWSQTTFPLHLNILYAEWYWDHEALDKIYEKLCVRNPYNVSQFVPWMINYYEQGTYPWKGKTCSKVLISLKTGINWTDDMPAVPPDIPAKPATPVTVNDVVFSLIEVSKLLLSEGYSPPWWYTATQHILDYKMIDPLTIELLLDVESVWALKWVLVSVPIIPEHIVRPQVEKWDPTGYFLNETRPDKGLVGTGPFKFVNLTWAVSLEMEVNKNYFRYCPIMNEFNVTWVDYETISYPLCRADPGYPQKWTWVTIDYNVRNQWLNWTALDTIGGYLEVNIYIYEKNSTGTFLLEEIHNEQIPCGESNKYTRTYNLTKCSHEFTIAVHIKGPAEVKPELANPWICQWINTTLPIWVTIKYDIGGPVKYLGRVVAPDCKVEGYDNAYVAYAYNTVPGDPRWKPNADVTCDYKIEGKDVAWIAKYYGKWMC